MSVPCCCSVVSITFFAPLWFELCAQQNIESKFHTNRIESVFVFAYVYCAATGTYEQTESYNM